MANENKVELSDAEIAAKTGFGETAEELENGNAPESEEESGDEDDQEADPPEEDPGDEPEVERKTREVSKKDDEEADDADEPEDEPEEGDSDEDGDSDKPESNKDKRTVPYSLLKNKNDKIKKLNSELTEARQLLEKAKKGGDEDDIEAATEEVEKAAIELAEKLGMEKDGVAEILKAAVKLSSKKSVIPKDIEEKLKIIDDFKKQQTQDKEVQHFKNEWDSLDIKKQYPNASPKAIEEAMKEMDKLAHSKDHHKHDLDYILYKNKSKFDSILKTLGKKKSGEVGKEISRATEDADEEGEDIVDIEDLTPAVMKRREERELEMRKKHIKDKDYRIYNPKERD